MTNSPVRYRRNLLTPRCTTHLHPPSSLTPPRRMNRVFTHCLLYTDIEGNGSRSPYVWSRPKDIWRSPATITCERAMWMKLCCVHRTQTLAAVFRRPINWVYAVVVIKRVNSQEYAITHWRRPSVRYHRHWSRSTSLPEAPEYSAPSRQSASVSFLSFQRRIQWRKNENENANYAVS